MSESCEIGNCDVTVDDGIITICTSSHYMQNGEVRAIAGSTKAIEITDLQLDAIVKFVEYVKSAEEV